MGARMLNYDERVRITDAFERGNDVALIAKMYGISTREVYRLEERKKAGDLALHVHDRGRKPKLSAEQKDQIRDLLLQQPDITLKDIIKALNLPVSEATLCRVVRKEGFRLKKKVIHASEQKRPRCAEETS